MMVSHGIDRIDMIYWNIVLGPYLDYVQQLLAYNGVFACVDREVCRARTSCFVFTVLGLFGQFTKLC